MFKYISNILSTITPGQRLVVLCVLLLSVVIITVSPSIVDAVTKDNEELKSKVALQKTEIAEIGRAHV